MSLSAKEGTASQIKLLRKHHEESHSVEGNRGCGWLGFIVQGMRQRVDWTWLRQARCRPLAQLVSGV